MKQKLFLLLAVIGMMVPQVAFAIYVDGINYTFSTYGAEVVHSDYKGNVEIPSLVKYKGSAYSVTSIGNTAFYGCSGLTSITIPNSVTSIGDYAFKGCSGLTSITIPNSVKSIGKDAFEDCSGVKELIYAEGCTKALRTGLTSITSLKIPNSVTSIGESAFRGCGDLTSVTIPNGVTSIENYAFSDCSGLTSIIVESGNTKYDSRGNCNAVIETASNTLRIGCQNTIIPNSVTSIGSSAFFSCSGLTSITIPNSVKSIGDEAFSYCDLTSITIPYSVISIGTGTFEGCIDLAKVYTGKSVEIIPESCFENCTSLDTLIIGESTRQIDKNAFKGCERITQIHSHNYIPPTCATDFPEYVYKAAVVYVPNTHNAVARYQADDIWKKFFEIYDEDITGVENTSINTNAPASFINLGGQYISKAQRGINLQKMPDGTTKKVLMR